MRQLNLALTLAAVVAGVSACSSGSGTGPGGGPLGGMSNTIVASGTTGGNTGYGNNGGGQFYFSPAPDTVAAGSMVTFEFRDVEHTVTFDRNPGRVVDIPATAEANSTRTFAAGTYTFHCSIHPYMHGTIVAQ